MRFASFTGRDAAGFGIVERGCIRPVVDSRFADLKSVIAAGAYDEAAAAATDPVDLDDLSLTPALPNPGKIICIGMNYLAHIKEMGRERPAYPTLFTRFADSLVGHGLRDLAAARLEPAQVEVVAGRQQARDLLVELLEDRQALALGAHLAQAADQGPDAQGRRHGGEGGQDGQPEGRFGHPGWEGGRVGGHGTRQRSKRPRPVDPVPGRLPRTTPARASQPAPPSLD